MDAHFNNPAWHVAFVPRHFLHALGMLLFGLLLTGCGGGDSAPTSVAALQQAASEPNTLAARGAPPAADKPARSAATDEAAALPVAPATLAQLSALPHLSSLSDREKAGLILLLPSRSASQRLELINMYPSLVRLPEQQKELLLNQLEKIVPVTVSQSQ
ncbi:hypothetical protein [Burkholderia sp. WSM2232]|uniref:hypothetical protein n=1 Tax=Burkholderia sp. WSM2232 TaxID=944436 RepID=UPI001E42CD02|nr:hypothetical protein [Burkholderia sp. WSM2232]